MAKSDLTLAIERLEEQLQKLSASCCSWTHGAVGSLAPTLHVAGVGMVEFPLSLDRAKALVAQAQQAPYGRGSETIVDLNVRRVWQLNPEQFEIAQQTWTPVLDRILQLLKHGLEIESSIEASLYKLLVYEPGGFFAPHKDSEKTDRMFATLVICLPSIHTGGELRLEHNGSAQVIDFGPQSATDVQYAAFYADCQHEILPVLQGYRVCLVYNLSWAGKRPPADQLLPAVVAQIRQPIQTLIRDGQLRWAIPLDHEYTEHSFSLDNLKGADIARFQALGQVAKSLDLDCHLALLYVRQEGSSDQYYDHRHQGPRHYTMSEVHEEEIMVSHWFDAEGRPKRWQPLSLEAQQFISTAEIEDLPFKKSFTEATGNEGATIERRYRTAVVVLWAISDKVRMASSESQHFALPLLRDMIEAGEPHSELLNFAKCILDNWRFPTGSYVSVYAPYYNLGSASKRMLWCLRHLKDSELAERFLSQILPRDYDGKEGKSLARLAQAMGWEILQTTISKLIQQQERGEDYNRLSKLVRLVHGLVCCPNLGQAGAKLRHDLFDLLLKRWKAWDAQAGSNTRDGLLELAIEMGTTLGADQLQTFLTHVIENPNHYDLYTIVIPAVRALKAQASPAYQRLLQHCKLSLQKATAQPVVVPQHWSSDLTPQCSCAECIPLKAFLLHPTTTVYRYKANEKSRKHLMRSLSRTDLDFEVDKSGNTHTLICRKNRASYQRRDKKMAEDLALLQELSGH